ncbi:MAG: hypothetical protein V4475_19860 [Pseudomonadota bacterium]
MGDSKPGIWPTKLSGQLAEFAVRTQKRADDALDDIDDSLRQEAKWLDQCRPEGILRDFDSALRKRCLLLATRLPPLARDMIAARISLEQFKRRNIVSDDIGHGKRFDMAIVGQLGVLLIGEFIANAVFQSDLQKDGLLGGLKVAVFCSLATVVLGVMFAIGRQYTHTSTKGKGWIGFSLLGVSTIAAYLFVSLLSLIRLNGEAGDMEAILTARSQIMADPFAGVRAMLDLPAFAYTICIVALIASVAFKYLGYAGAFPGYRKHALEFLDAEDAVESEYGETTDDLHAIADSESQRLEAAPEFIISCKVPIQTLVADHENVLDRYRHDIGDLSFAARLFDEFCKEYSIAGLKSDQSVLLSETRKELEAYRDELAARQQRFRDTADELCSREDVSDAMVEDARQRFDHLVEAKLKELAGQKSELLDAALADYKKNRSWLSEVLAPVATEVAATPATA